jgi:hypothetical protein
VTGIRLLRIAVSGHRGLPPETGRLVDKAVRAALARLERPVTGLSCLADGADQIFACAVLDHGGQLEAIIPAAEYRTGLPSEVHARYDHLLDRALSVHQLPFAESTSEAHMAASQFMLSSADQLWAVWDGQPARGHGGTADVVAHARSEGVPVQVIWPAGASRD